MKQIVTGSAFSDPFRPQSSPDSERYVVSLAFMDSEMSLAPSTSFFDPKSGVHPGVSAITELVYFIEPHDHLNPVSVSECNCPWRIYDGVVMLEFKSSGFPSRVDSCSEKSFCLGDRYAYESLLARRSPTMRKSVNEESLSLNPQESNIHSCNVYLHSLQSQNDTAPIFVEEESGECVILAWFTFPVEVACRRCTDDCIIHLIWLPDPWGVMRGPVVCLDGRSDDGIFQAGSGVDGLSSVRVESLHMRSSGMCAIDGLVWSGGKDAWAESEAPVVPEAPDAPDGGGGGGVLSSFKMVEPVVVHMLFGVQHFPCRSSPPTCVGAEFPSCQT
ncbi:hypothetical protein Tco_0567281 [Tanacetum coccineum]